MSSKPELLDLNTVWDFDEDGFEEEIFRLGEEDDVDDIENDDDDDDAVEDVMQSVNEVVSEDGDGVEMEDNGDGVQMEDEGGDINDVVIVGENMVEDCGNSSFVAKAIRVFEGNCDTEAVKEPTVGMSFDSGEQFAAFCYSYAYRTGFEWFSRTNDVKKEFKDEGVSRKHGGAKEPKFYMMSRIRLICKKGGSVKNVCANVTGCTAKVDGRERDGRFVITKCELNHNHDTDPSESHRMVSFRKLGDYFKKKAVMNDAAGIPIVKNFNSILLECGGHENLTFNKRDFRNAINQERRISRIHGDAAALEAYFEKLKAENSDCYYAILKNDDGRLVNVFWADARCRALAKVFMDAVTFDTTFLCNRYKMPFAPFIGINHHGSSIILAAALISHEDADSFVWVFERWMDCMGKAPSVILTDQCKAIGKAVSIVFPNTPHRLCLWHIMRNGAKNLGAHAQWKLIEVDLKSVVHDSLTMDDFMESWADMVVKYGIDGNAWIKESYEIRERWAPAYWRHVFCAGMSSTQRSEQQNRFIKGFVSVETSLIGFINQFEMALKSKVEEERQMDYDCAHKIIPYDNTVLVEEVFHKIYTNQKFKEVQTESYYLTHTSVTCVGQVGSYKKFTANEKYMRHGCNPCRRYFDVSIDRVLGDFQCSCKLFEFRGILCRHIIRCIEDEDIKFIPEKYILNRWRKNLVRGFEHIRVGYYDPVECVRVKKAMELTVQNDYMTELAMMDDEVYDLYRKRCDEVRKELEDRLGIDTLNAAGLGGQTLRVWCRRRLQNREKNMRHVSRGVVPSGNSGLVDPIDKRGVGRASKPKQKTFRNKVVGISSSQPTLAKKRRMCGI